MTNWQTVHDSRVERPKALDKTSSAYVVYERRNIRQETRNIDGVGELTEWVYEQRTHKKDEYAELERHQLNDEITATQEALCDVYESTSDELTGIEMALCDIYEQGLARGN